MIPSRGAIQSVSNCPALRRVPAQNATRLPRAWSLQTGRRHLSSTGLGRLSPRPGVSVLGARPSVAAAGLLAASPYGARSLSLWPSSLWPSSIWPFGSSKSPSPESALNDAHPTPSSPVQTAAAPDATAAAAAESAQAATATTAAPPLDPNPEVAAILEEFKNNPSAGSIDPFSGDSILDIPEHIGYLHSLGIDFGWGPSSSMMWILEHIHVYSGMPWWGSIIATAAFIRIIMIPMVVNQSESMRKMTELSQNPQFKSLQAKFMEMIKSGEAANNKTEFATIRNLTTTMRKDSGVRLSDMWLPLTIQIPLGFAMWRILRTMADIPVPGLETGGLLWFTDLAVADPYYILPLINPVVLYGMMKANAAFQTEQQRRQGQKMFWILSPIGVFVTLWLPSALQMYFISTFAFTAIQTFLIRNNKVRAAVGLVPMTLPTPEAKPASLQYEAPRPQDPKKTVVQKLVDTVNEAVPWAQTSQESKEKQKRAKDERDASGREKGQVTARRKAYEKKFR